MRQLITILFIFGFSLLSFGQKSSVGLSLSAFEQYSGSSLFNSGAKFATNYQFQFSNNFGWRTELVYGDYKNIKVGSNSSGNNASPNSSGTFPIPGTVTSSDNDFSKHFFMLRSSIAIQIFDMDWLAGEVLFGPGLYKEEEGIVGLFYSELFLHKNISDRFALGLPVSFNYIFGHPRSISTVGLSLRYYI